MADYVAQPPTKDNTHPDNRLAYDPSTNKYLTGRPTKYYPERCTELIDFFNVPLQDPETGKAITLPTIERFCSNIGIHVDTFYEWEQRHSMFSDAAKKARQLQKAIWIENSLKGRYNTPFTIFMGKNVFGWQDKQDVNVTVSIEDKIRQIDARSEPEAIEATVVDDED